MIMKSIEGKIIDHYRLVSKIGSGTTSEVYLAHDLQIGASWAIKIIDKQTNTDEYKKQKNEAILLSKLSHPVFPRVIPTLYDTDQTLSIVMDYVPGITLFDYLKAGNPVTVEKIVDWIKQISEGIQYLHEQGFVYCDLKLDNLILSDNQIKIIDLGAALKIGDTVSKRYGNEEFAAPEYAAPVDGIQIPVGSYTDNYAIGIIGKKLLDHLKDDKIPKEIDELFDECILSDYKSRIQSTKTIVEKLKDFEKQTDPLMRYKRRLAIFIVCVSLSIISFIIGTIGYVRCVEEYSKDFDFYINQAIKYEQSGNEEEAVEAYLNACVKNPKGQDVYDKIYHLLAPDSLENIDEKNRSLLDVFRERTETKYLDDTLRVELAEICLNQDSEIYIQYASELLKGVNNEKATVLKMLLEENQDTDKILDNMTALIKNSNDEEEVLNNTNLLTMILTKYNNWTLESVKEIEGYLDGVNDEIKNNNIATLEIYKRIALGLSNSNDDTLIKEASKWWEKLDDYQDTLSKDELITEGIAFRKMEDYDKALQCFKQAILKDNTDVISYLYAAKAAMNVDATETKRLWNEINNLKNSQSGKLSANVLNQINALEVELKMKGIIS